jgi:outer membrane receptor for ferrienterochelin and colicins
MRKLHFLSLLVIGGIYQANAQSASIEGNIVNKSEPAEFVSTSLKGTSMGAATDSLGRYRINNITPGAYRLVASFVGFDNYEKDIVLKEGQSLILNIDLSSYDNATNMDGIVISGTMRPVRKLESPVPVEVYSPTFFKKNPTPNLFEALQNINGVRPQLNCNVCNTGDIHINGLEGPYTMVLIDGMPIVSSLGTVYGLSGIPRSLINRVEVVKGPASALYGSEAMGGLINVITKNPNSTPLFSADISGTTWGEYNADLSTSFTVGKKASVLTGINYFNFQNKFDKDGDGFTDKTLQNRISIFQKWNFDRKDDRVFTLAGRYLYEDRWGGDMRWNKPYRGGDEIYAESIYTNRVELLGNYQLPVKEQMFLGFSLINHDQDSRYGDEPYIASQKIAFGQLIWSKTLGKNELLAGAAMRYTYYDDNTPATTDENGVNQPEDIYLPGIFVQNELKFNKKHSILLGARYDYNNIHGSIFTPRFAYKWSKNKDNVLRFNLGTGYRVVNVFNEDHAALTGGRGIVFLEDLKPEKSYNANLNYVKHIYTESGSLLGFDATVFYTYFTNRILPDYETNPTQILYSNLDGHSISAGVSLNMNVTFTNGFSFLLGGTIMDNTITENGLTERIEKAENFTGTWSASYKIRPWHLAIDYTGNVYSPMRLPLQGDLDPRLEYSPWWSIQNIQFTYSGLERFEFYAGVKNLLNWTIGKATKPFLIARPDDPFDDKVTFDGDGNPVPIPNNPYGLVFDPDSYSYGPNQGLHGFLGVRFNFR